MIAAAPRWPSLVCFDVLSFCPFARTCYSAAGAVRRYPDQYRLLSGGSYAYTPDEFDRGRKLEKVGGWDARGFDEDAAYGSCRV